MAKIAAPSEKDLDNIHAEMLEVYTAFRSLKVSGHDKLRAQFLADLRDLNRRRLNLIKLYTEYLCDMSGKLDWIEADATTATMLNIHNSLANVVGNLESGLQAPSNEPEDFSWLVVASLIPLPEARKASFMYLLDFDPMVKYGSVLEAIKGRDNFQEDIEELESEEDGQKKYRVAIGILKAYRDYLTEFIAAKQKKSLGAKTRDNEDQTGEWHAEEGQ